MALGRRLYSLRTRALNWQAFRLRSDWPAHPPADPPRVSVVMVSYNTLEFTAMMLWSLRRVADPSQVSQVVVVDNGSSDGSRQVLRYLAREGVIELSANWVQRFHGPGLQQGIRHLARAPERTDQILIVDSDVVFLRPDAISAPSAALTSSGAALLGEHHNGTELVNGGYAHISTLFIDPVQVVRCDVPPFIDSGHPGVLMQKWMRQAGVPICNFPLRSDNYVLHAEGATLDHLLESGNRRSSHAQFVRKRGPVEMKYHRNPAGRELLDGVRARFREEVPEVTGPLLRAAMTGPLVSIDL